MKKLFALLALLSSTAFATDYGPLNAPVNLTVQESGPFSDTETFIINFDPTQYTVGPTNLTVHGMVQAGSCGRGCIFYRQTEISSVTLIDTSTGLQALDVNGAPVTLVDNPAVGYTQHTASGTKYWTYDVWTASAQLANGTYELVWSGDSCSSRTPPCTSDQGSAYLYSTIAVDVTVIAPPPPPPCTDECGDRLNR